MPPSILPFVSSTSARSSLSSTVALPVTVVPSCLRVNVFLHTNLRIEFHFPCASDIRGFAARCRGAKWLAADSWVTEAATVPAASANNSGPISRSRRQDCHFIALRHVIVAVDSSFLERDSIRLGSPPSASAAFTKFRAAVTDEDELDLLFEIGGHDIIHRNRSAAEETDVRELIEILQGNQLVSIPPIERPAMARLG